MANFRHDDIGLKCHSRSKYKFTLGPFQPSLFLLGLSIGCHL